MTLNYEQYNYRIPISGYPENQALVIPSYPPASAYPYASSLPHPGPSLNRGSAAARHVMAMTSDWDEGPLTSVSADGSEPIPSDPPVGLSGCEAPARSSAFDEAYTSPQHGAARPRFVSEAYRYDVTFLLFWSVLSRAAEPVIWPGGPNLFSSTMPHKYK